MTSVRYAKGNPTVSVQTQFKPPAQYKPLDASATSKEASLDRPVGDPVTLFAIRFLAAAALIVTAYIHVALALEHGLSDAPISLGQMFIGQAVVLTVVAGLLLFRAGNRIWLLAVLVALGSAVPLLDSVYLPMPAIGPFPPIDEPVWYLEKALSLAAELAVPALWLLRRIAPPAH